MRKATDIYDINCNQSSCNFEQFAYMYVTEKRRPIINIPKCENPLLYVNRVELEKIGKTGRLIDLESGEDLSVLYLRTFSEGHPTKATGKLLLSDEVSRFYKDPLKDLWEHYEIEDCEKRKDIRKAIRQNNLGIETQKELVGNLRELLPIVTRFVVESEGVMHYVYAFSECGRCKPCFLRKQSQLIRLCGYEQLNSPHHPVLFQTLTYPNQTLPLDELGYSRGVSQRAMRGEGRLCMRDLQLFVKRVKEYFVKDNCEYRYQCVRYIPALGYHVYCVGTQMKRDDGKRSLWEEYGREVKIDGKLQSKRLVGEPVLNKRYKETFGFVRRKGYDDLKYTIKGIVDANGKTKEFVVSNDVKTSDGSYLLDSVPLYDIHRIRKFKYFACGEYGSKSHHPHFHLLYYNYPIRFATPTIENNNNLELVRDYVQPYINRCWCGDDTSFGGQCMDNINKGILSFKGLGETYREASIADIRKAEKYGNVAIADINGKRYVAFNPVEIARDAAAYVTKYVSKGQSDKNGHRNTFFTHSNNLGSQFVVDGFREKRVSYDGLHYLQNGKLKVDVIPATLAKSVFPSANQFVNGDTTKALTLLHDRIVRLVSDYVNSFRTMLHLFTIPQEEGYLPVRKPYEDKKTGIEIDEAKVIENLMAKAKTPAEAKKIRDRYECEKLSVYYMIPTHQMWLLAKYSVYLTSMVTSKIEEGDLFSHAYTHGENMADYLLEVYNYLRRDVASEICRGRELLKYFRLNGCVSRSYDVDYSVFDQLLLGLPYCVEPFSQQGHELLSINDPAIQLDMVTKFLSFDSTPIREYMPLNAVHASAISQFNTLVRKTTNAYVQSGLRVRQVPSFRRVLDKDKEGYTEFGEYVEYSFGNTSFRDGDVDTDFMAEELMHFRHKRDRRAKKTPIYYQGRFYPRTNDKDEFVGKFGRLMEHRVPQYRNFFKLESIGGVPLIYIAHIIKAGFMTDAKLCYVLGLQPVIFHFKGEGYEPPKVDFHKKCKDMSIREIVKFLSNLDLKPVFTLDKVQKDNVEIITDGEFNPSVRSVISSERELVNYVEAMRERNENGLRKYPVRLMNQVVKDYRQYRLATSYHRSLACGVDMDYDNIVQLHQQGILHTRETIAKRACESKKFHE